MGNMLEDWVGEKIDERNEKLAESKDIMIEVDPEIARIFKNSSFVSCMYYDLLFLFRLIFIYCLIYI